jgi:hypothetical protein
MEEKKVEEVSQKGYIDNKAFYDEIVEWWKVYELDNTTQISDSIAKKLMLISSRITYRPNFRNYSYRDEMAEDGLENCVRYFKTYNPEKSKNPFSYFSTVCYMASVNRINKEKRQQATKAKYVQGMAVDAIEFASTQAHDSMSEMGAELKEYLGNYYNFDLDAYAAIGKKEKAKKKQKEMNTLI